jgi:NAD(P)-dependent dehydrogenase (short-subunit alcohol dehydrogenase family)
MFQKTRERASSVSQKLSVHVGEQALADTVIVLGAGGPNGIGGAVAMKFATQGLHVLVCGRTLSKVEETAHWIRSTGASADALACDVTSEDDQKTVFGEARKLGQPLAAVIYNAGNNAPIPFEDLDARQFEDFWRVCCLGGFLSAKQAMPLLSRQGYGSMLFTGASASLRGKANFGHFAAAKGALRNLAQSLAREYGPRGVHVAHVIIDGVVNGDRIRTRYGEYLENLGEDGALSPPVIAEAFWMIHSQHRSAWTHELDLRPFKEAW